MKNNKPTILLLHGYRGAPVGVEQIAQELRTQGYDVNIPAVPPFAGAKLLEKYSAKNYADFVKDYIEQHGLEKPILVGHSMGSIIAASVAASYPELIDSKIILLSPISKSTPKALALLSMAAAYLPRKLVDYVTTKVLYVGKNRSELREILEITDQCTRVTKIPRRDMARAGLFSASHGILDFDFDKDTLLLAGAKDRLVSQKDTKKLAKKLNAKLVFLENTGHIHNYEKPRETAAEIIKFLEK